MVVLSSLCMCRSRLCADEAFALMKRVRLVICVCVCACFYVCVRVSSGCNAQACLFFQVSACVGRGSALTERLR